MFKTDLGKEKKDMVTKALQEWKDSRIDLFCHTLPNAPTRCIRRSPIIPRERAIVESSRVSSRDADPVHGNRFCHAQQHASHCTEYASLIFFSIIIASTIIRKTRSIRMEERRGIDASRFYLLFGGGIVSTACSKGGERRDHSN